MSSVFVGLTSVLSTCHQAPAVTLQPLATATRRTAFQPPSQLLSHECVCMHANEQVFAVCVYTCIPACVCGSWSRSIAAVWHLFLLCVQCFFIFQFSIGDEAQLTFICIHRRHTFQIFLKLELVASNQQANSSMQL